jgi:hypothetical protein
VQGRSARGADTALTLALCSISCFARMSWFSWVEISLGAARVAKRWSGVDLTSPCCNGSCSSPDSTLGSTTWSNTRSGLFGHESISESERIRKRKL